jgi:hypothetical protein
MKRHRTVVLTLVLTAGLSACAAPSAALAAGPLLSGYGGPGAGTQAIIGSTLLGGGSSGGSRGGGSQGGGAEGGSGAAAQGIAGNGSHGTLAANGARERGRGGGSGAGAGRPSGRATGTPPRAAGAPPKTSDLLSAQATSATQPSWLSGGDILALVLAASALGLVGLATVRLARTEHH